MSIFNYLLNRNLAHVKRFNNRPLLFGESVAEHSFYVAHYTQLLCWLLESKKIKIDTQKAVSMALIHDSEEGFSGDILNPFKHFNDKIASAIAEVNEETIELMFEELPKELSGELIELWHEEQKRVSIESQVVKVADSLSLLSKCFEEMEAGNSNFHGIYKREISNLNKLNYPWWKKIKKEVMAESSSQI
ncbi:MAG TPA: YfbR-like 5'-deoxynucleotidase [Candidatus Saccharimonadales bacterium]|nr:YfbR-like 5'-deoxynucleotidase [Candidatus Saccharimonadales bacterium]